LSPWKHRWLLAGSIAARDRGTCKQGGREPEPSAHVYECHN